MVLSQHPATLLSQRLPTASLLGADTSGVIEYADKIHMVEHLVIQPGCAEEPLTLYLMYYLIIELQQHSQTCCTLGPKSPQTR